jgi:periplasmic protein CpxP/Spy
MKKRWVVITAVCAMGAALVAYGAAQQNENGRLRERFSGLMIRGVESDLGITDAQREQIKAILRTEQPTIQSLAAQVHDEELQLRAQPDFDEAYVRAFAKQHESTMEDALVERQRVRSEIRAVLTPEQREKADQMRSMFYSRFTDRLATLGDRL